MALIFFKVPYFYDNKFEAAWVTGAFNAAIRHVYIIFLAIVITGVILGYGRFLAKLWNYGIYRILGRLSFTVYMIHYTIIMIVMSQQKSPLEISKLMTVAWITEVFFLRLVEAKNSRSFYQKFFSYSNVAAIFLALFVELPVYAVMKAILAKEPEAKETELVIKMIPEHLEHATKARNGGDFEHVIK